LEAELIARCRQGDPQAIEELVRENQASIYRLCLSVLNDADEAEDAVQESLIAALSALDKYRGDSAFSTWLYTIALNTSRGMLRKRKRRTVLKETLTENPMTDEIDRKTPERSVLEDERSRLLWAAIDELDEKHRLPIILRYFHEMPTEEIAEVLEISVGTVHSRLHNARSRLNGDLQRIQQGLGGAE
jgi:RNA polymerase sigma-70 factor (ECF subfamily)